MKFTGCILLLIGSSFWVTAQESKSFTINPLKEKTAELTVNLYQYPTFLDGKVIFRDSALAFAKMNYHRLFGQILFLDENNDTLALANPETFLYVTIKNDTFYYVHKGFARKLTHHKTKNLVLVQTIRYIGNEKAGPYGSYSAVASSNSNSTYTPDDQITQYIELNQNLVYKYKNLFYLTDAFNNFFIASKKNFYNLFSRHTRALRQYLNTHKINFNKQQDLEQLLTFLQGLSEKSF
ncbi:MAG: hypothetical protein GC171_12650 [Terrimonas sp.]|nr:hypothetical protein [Terrimonas sp.]